MFDRCDSRTPDSTQPLLFSSPPPPPTQQLNRCHLFILFCTIKHCVCVCVYSHNESSLANIKGQKSVEKSLALLYFGGQGKPHYFGTKMEETKPTRMDVTWQPSLPPASSPGLVGDDVLVLLQQPAPGPGPGPGPGGPLEPGLLLHLLPPLLHPGDGGGQEEEDRRQHHQHGARPGEQPRRPRRALAPPPGGPAARGGEDAGVCAGAGAGLEGTLTGRR